MFVRVYVDPAAEGRETGRAFRPSLQKPGQHRQERELQQRSAKREAALFYTGRDLGLWPPGLGLQFPQGLLQNLRTSKTLSRNSHPSKPALLGCNCRRSPGVTHLAGPHKALQCPPGSSAFTKLLFLFSVFLGVLTAMSTYSEAHGCITTGPRQF